MNAETESVQERVARGVRDAIDRDYIEVFYDHDEVQGYTSMDDLIEQVTAAALAAVADATGLVGVLREHRLVSHPAYTPYVCECGFKSNYHWRHLADVVRAWLRGRG